MSNRSRARSSGTHRGEPPRFPFPVVVGTLIVITTAALAWRTGGFGLLRSNVTAPPTSGAPAGSGHPAGRTGSGSATGGSPGSAAITSGPINTELPGLTTFRGNATRDYYGQGPLPAHPVIRWRFPSSGGLCSTSSNLGTSAVWCGTGWTGQPNVIQHRDGTIEVREGAYDDHYHFLNGLTGKRLRPDLVTGDLAKGSATSDSNSYPLYYGGSRDNYLRVVALDRPKPTVLWRFDSRSQRGWVWNDDWDAAPLQIGDYLLEGCENSWFYVIRLNRHYDAAGKVEVNPQIVMRVPGWDQQLLNTVHDKDISIEDSVAYDANTGVVYFANGGGLVQGWNIRDILSGGTHYSRVFRFWDGDDTDATPIIDPTGDVIIGRKMEANVARPESLPRDHQVGDLMKLNPRDPAHPLVWSVQLGGFSPDGGVLGTPALYKGVVYASYTEGGLAAVDEATGKLLWNIPLAGPMWSSPVPIDNKLLIADGKGNINCFDISHPGMPPELAWRLHVSDSVIESTPAVWHGWIYVGSRDGGIYGIANPKP